MIDFPIFSAPVTAPAPTATAATRPSFPDAAESIADPPGTCAAVAVACLALGAARPAPLGLALVVLLGIRWGLAVAYRVANAADSPVE